MWVNSPMSPRTWTSLIARYHGCQRKFSCTMNRTPAAVLSSTIRWLSSKVGASGF